MRAGCAPPRVGVVVLTYRRPYELMCTLRLLAALPERPPIVVVDNGSGDGVAEGAARAFPQVDILSLPRNIGAAARNLGVQRLDTPYVAFCDDDTWWEAGSLARAAELLDRAPRVAALSARILVGEQAREDATCRLMASSPLPADGLPGPALLGFMAGACVFRRTAFLECGGYEPRLFLGGEEALLALDLASRGWSMVYAQDLVVHHHPSALRDAQARALLLARNAIWIAWLRRPWKSALEESAAVLARCRREGHAFACLRAALGGVGWVLANRRVVPPHIEAARRLLDQHGEPRQGREPAARLLLRR